MFAKNQNKGKWPYYETEKKFMEYPVYSKYVEEYQDPTLIRIQGSC